LFRSFALELIVSIVLVDNIGGFSMKFPALFVAVLASAPALAVTAENGAVRVGTRVTIGTNIDTDSASDSGPGAPASLLASTSSVLLDGQTQAIITAFASTSATWSSARSGSAAMFWGWNALNPAGGTSAVETNVSAPNWSYSFTTGNSAGSFNARWTLDAGFEVGSTFGIQGVYGDGASPFNITPDTSSPLGLSSGSFSVALAPNTSYLFGFRNFGNLGGSLNHAAFANFNMDWDITSTAIPEPASWALLIAGFGLVGAAQRLSGHRRRRAVTA
jgi:hypothetical protein